MFCGCGVDCRYDADGRAEEVGAAVVGAAPVGRDVVCSSEEAPSDS